VYREPYRQDCVTAGAVEESSAVVRGRRSARSARPTTRLGNHATTGRIADIEEVAYYAERAAQGLDLFTQSPYRRLPGAHNRLGERQTKLAGTTGRIASTGKVKKLPSSRPFASSASLLGGGRK
jgi:hypothetical protein